MYTAKKDGCTFKFILKACEPSRSFCFYLMKCESRKQNFEGNICSTKFDKILCNEIMKADYHIRKMNFYKEKVLYLEQHHSGIPQAMRKKDRKIESRKGRKR